MSRRNLRSSGISAGLGGTGSGLGLNDVGPLRGNGDSNDPMASMGNLMDVMLVFACGLLLALIANWNVDLDGMRVTSGAQSYTPLEGDVQDASTETAEDVMGYTELGTAYYDEETGQVYVVAPQDSGEASAE